MISFNNRAHLYSRPDTRPALIDFFTNLLGAQAMEMPGSSIVAFRFPDNSSVSYDFTDDALDDAQARRGAWLEFKTDDPKGLQAKILAAGLVQVEYSATGRFYFQTPGGQVWGILGNNPGKAP